GAAPATVRRSARLISSAGAGGAVVRSASGEQAWNPFARNDPTARLESEPSLVTPPDIRGINWARHATRGDPRRRRNMRGIKSGRPRQMRLPLTAARTWGGARKGAGRKPRGRPSMPHVTRPKLDPRYPVQITIRTT